MASRLGGDEYCVLFEGDLKSAEPPLRRLARFVEVLNEARPIDFPVDYSVGGACFDPARHKGLLELFSEADQHMYRAKGAGGSSPR